MKDLFKKFLTWAAPAPAAPPTYWLTRFVLLRLLGAVYAIAFLVAARQNLPLIGAHGLTPMAPIVHEVAKEGNTWTEFWRYPSLFWFAPSDAALQWTAWTGLALSCVVLLGYANAPMMLVLWALYMSLVHLGLEWYGYGWEIQLLETGFLGVFLCPLLDGRPFPRRVPPAVVIWLFRWLIFRIMVGAGLIKIRGDECWRDLTALYYHFETQPIPNGLSRWFHFLPRGVLRAGVGANHFSELIAPWFAFWPRAARFIAVAIAIICPLILLQHGYLNLSTALIIAPVAVFFIWPRASRHLAGAVMVLFQFTLILSGNLSFLNWLTIVPALACFDDSFWRKILPRRIVGAAEEAAARAQSSAGMKWSSWIYAGIVAALSIPVVKNLASPGQLMNNAYEPFGLVNTYGAFGSVGKQRLNVIFEGTDAAFPEDNAVWKPYPYIGLPVDLEQRPPQVAPYQLRLDWQMWFAAMGSPQQYPFTLNVAWKLLHNDPGTLGLFADNPFPEKPPRYVRARLYVYSFAPPGNADGAYWTRKDLGNWLPPLSLDYPGLREELVQRGWLDEKADVPP